LTFENQKRQELEKLINVLLKKEQAFSDELSLREKNITELKEELSGEKELSKITNERLTNKLAELQFQLKSLFELKKKVSELTFLKKDLSDKTRIISKYEK
jgi:hypothetical protein